MAKLKITELVLRDAHQSLLATRMRLDDMLPIAKKIDDAGYWSIESWGGATFDSCIRYLGEDPWERIRALKKATRSWHQSPSRVAQRKGTPTRRAARTRIQSRLQNGPGAVHTPCQRAVISYC